MGLSVGVVSIDYLDEPQPPVSDFLKELAMNPDLGVGEDDGDSWGGGWGENTFLEFEQPTLTERAGNWCTEKGVSASERTALMTWLSGLPWREGYVILHLGV